MSNSPLVQVTQISPNKTKRCVRSTSSNGKISKITIHHTAGVISAASCLAWFARSSTQASSNYVIGYDGTIGLSVPEDYRSWCSSNGDNDNISVCLELSNSATGNPWPVSDKVIERCVELCVDICQRNGIEAISYTGTKDGTLTRHDMFTNKVCPGPYLGAKLADIARAINTKLGKPDFRPTLKNGCSGGYVTEMQEDLLKLDYYLASFGADGDFGEATENAVKQFQKDFKLDEVDGICGSATWAELLKAVKPEEEEEDKDETDGEQEEVAYIIKIVENTPIVSAAPYKILTCGRFTIEEEKNGYGKLKSGAGWIPLDMVERLN